MRDSIVQLKYLTGYPDELRNQVQALIENDQLADFLTRKYPKSHDIRTDKALYQYAVSLKNDYLNNTPPLHRVGFDNKIHIIKHALGMHTSTHRAHGGNIKARHGIAISSLFKQAPLEFLRMIVVHELAHLREREHNKRFYQLCEHMEPDYHQLEFDLRLYLTYSQHSGLRLWGDTPGEQRANGQ